MSVNSLLTNPKIFDELLLYVEENLTSDGILTLNNDDGNFNLTVNGDNGVIDLSNNIVVNNIIEANTVTTNLITNENILINKPSSSVSLFPTGIILCNGNNNNNNITFSTTNANLSLNNIQLILNNSINPFSTDGSGGQLLSTNGNNILKWIDNAPIIPPNYISQLGNIYSSQLPEQGPLLSLTIFNLNIDGFQQNKQYIFKVGVSFEASNVGGPIDMNLIFDGNSNIVTTYINSDEFGTNTFRGFLIVTTNSSETSNLNVTLTISNQDITTPVQFSTNTADYYTLLIQEIE